MKYSAAREPAGETRAPSGGGGLRVLGPDDESTHQALNTVYGKHMTPTTFGLSRLPLADMEVRVISDEMRIGSNSNGPSSSQAFRPDQGSPEHSFREADRLGAE